LSTPVENTLLETGRTGNSFSNFPYCPKAIAQVQPAIEYQNLQSITIPVF